MKIYEKPMIEVTSFQSADSIALGTSSAATKEAIKKNANANITTFGTLQ